MSDYEEPESKTSREVGEELAHRMARTDWYYEMRDHIAYLTTVMFRDGLSRVPISNIGGAPVFIEFALKMIMLEYKVEPYVFRPEKQGSQYFMVVDIEKWPPS